VAGFPNLRHLRRLQEAARLGALSRAAEMLHVSQPAATQGMARLAALYGADLVARRGNGIAPTATGRIVLRRAARALALVAEASRIARPGPRAEAERAARQTSIAQLRAIAAFAKAGSFTAAATLLGQSEPSVQRAARDLERLGSAALFAGRQRTITLTAEGARVAERAGLALRELELARDEVNEAAGRVDGRLILGTLPLIRTAILPQAVIALAARHPEARIEILDGAYEDLLRRLRTGRADMILGALRGAGAGLAEEELFADDLAVIARTGHPLAGTGPDLAAAFGYPWVLSRRGTPNRAVFDRYAARFGEAPGARIETGSLVALRGILVGSDRLALLSRRQVHYELESRLLCDLGIPIDAGRRPIGVIRLADAHPTRLQADVLTELRLACGA
jgi:DNA-binding transcriptional LysR family regulator